MSWPGRIGFALCVIALVWVAAPVALIGWSAIFVDDYVLRDLDGEYLSRLYPRMVGPTDHAEYRMTCPALGSVRAVIIDTARFSETADQFVERRYGNCLDVRRVANAQGAAG